MTKGRRELRPFLPCYRAVIAGGKGPIGLCRVEEGNAQFQRRPDEGDHLPFVGRGAIGSRHAHAAKSHGGYFESISEFSFLHHEFRYHFLARGAGMLDGGGQRPVVLSMCSG